MLKLKCNLTIAGSHQWSLSSRAGQNLTPKQVRKLPDFHFHRNILWLVSQTLGSGGSWFSDFGTSGVFFLALLFSRFSFSSV